MEVRLARKKKLVNKTNIPEHEIEKIARCLLPVILAFYNSEEGQREFKKWQEVCCKTKEAHECRKWDCHHPETVP